MLFPVQSRQAQQNADPTLLGTKAPALTHLMAKNALLWKGKAMPDAEPMGSLNHRRGVFMAEWVDVPLHLHPHDHRKAAGFGPLEKVLP